MVMSNDFPAQGSTDWIDWAAEVDKDARVSHVDVNTLYVAANGSAANDGLSAAAPMDLQTALNRLRDYGPVLDGQWIIQHAAGVYEGGYAFPRVQSRRRVELRGPSRGGPRIYPTAIYRRAGAAVDWGIFTSEKASVRFADIAFEGYNRTPVNSGGIRPGQYADIDLWNVHTDGCEIGLFALDFTLYNFAGCSFKNSGYAAVHELYSVVRNSAATGEADRTVMQGGKFGIKAKELCTGHGDWTEFLDNEIAVHLSRSSTMNFSDATFKRNGTDVVTSGGSTFVDLQAKFGTGADASGVRYRYLAGATNVARAHSENEPATPYIGQSEKSLAYGRMTTAHTGTISDTLLVPLGAFEAGEFTGEGAWLRWEAWGECNLSAAGTLRLRAGGGLAVIAMPAGSYVWKYEGRVFVTADGDTQRVDSILHRSNGNPVFGGGNRTALFSTFAIAAGLYMTLGATADTIQVQQAQMFTSDL